jgi:kinesin family protein 11
MVKPGEGATVKVVVRVRPANEIELNASSPPVVQVQSADNSITVVKGAGKMQQRNVFNFDHVFGTYATQSDVFTTTLAPIVDDVLSGIESTVFAYGQTGTGKTYTMEGDIQSEEHKGVIPRAVEAIFHKLENKKYVSSDVAVSFLEIYNEDLTDLLSNQTGLAICADGDGQIICKGLSQQPIASSTEVLRVLRQAQQRRQTGETKMNKQSSRSHCLFTLVVRTVERVGECELERTGKLHLVDLAGSECAKTTGATGSRLRESQNINQSLLTLGRVIAALREKSSRIPYRDSKLTRLLSQALGGACRTCIIATLSPAALCAEESMSTLHYAKSAHGIKNKAVESNVRMAVGAGLNGGIGVTDAATFIEMQARLDYMENQCLEAQTALARQHDANVELQAQMDEVTRREEETRELYEQTHATLEETRATLQQTQADLDTQSGFTRSLQATLRGSVAALGDFAGREARARGDATAKVHESISLQAATVGKVRTETAALLAGLERKTEELGALVSGFSGSNVAAIRAAVSAQEVMGSALRAAVAAGFERLNTSVEASSTVFRNAEDELAAWGRDTTAKLQAHLASLEQQLAEQEKKVTETSEFFHRGLRAQLKGFGERRAALDAISKAARAHAKLGSQHLTSLSDLSAANARSFAQLTSDLEVHMAALATARQERSDGQRDDQLLASVAATTATLLSGAKGALASLSVQRNLIAGALEYQRAQTADGVLQAQLDKFLAAYGGANAEEDAMLGQSIVAAAEAATQAQVDGTIDAAHGRTIDEAAATITAGLQSEREQLAQLCAFQEKAAEALVAKVMDGVRALVTSEVMGLRASVEERVGGVQQVNAGLEATVAARRAALAGETETWARNNHAVADSLRVLRADAAAVQTHVAESRALVGRSVAGFSDTAKAWGEANREVDGRLAVAVQQNDAMHAAREEFTKAVEEHIERTTAEAEAWAAADGKCHAALGAAGEAVQAQLDAVAVAAATHGRLFDAAHAEAVEARTQGDAASEAVGDLSDSLAAATKAASDFQAEMAALCDEVASKHASFVNAHAGAHADIRGAVAAGLAPRGAVREQVDALKAQVQQTMAADGATHAAKIVAQQATLEQAMTARTAASEKVQSDGATVGAQAVCAASESRGSIDALCAAIVHAQLRGLDAALGAHNAAADAQASGFVRERVEAASAAVVASRGEAVAVPEIVRPVVVAPYAGNEPWDVNYVAPVVAAVKTAPVTAATTEVVASEAAASAAAADEAEVDAENAAPASNVAASTAARKRTGSVSAGSRSRSRTSTRELVAPAAATKGLRSRAGSRQ